MKGFLEGPLADISRVQSVSSVLGHKYHPECDLKLRTAERVTVNPVWVAYFSAEKVQD